MYIYQLTMGQHTQAGVLHLSSCIDYAEGRIKKHEKTLEKKEKDRTDLTDRQSANVGPVFLTFKENQVAIAAKIADITTQDLPYGDVTTEDGVRHVLWQCSVEDSAYLQNEFAKIEALYIADGHHRAAAAGGVYKRRREILEKHGQYTGLEDFNYFMSLSFPADNLLILDYNRVLKELNGLTNEQFMNELSKSFSIEQLAEGASTKV